MTSADAAYSALVMLVNPDVFLFLLMGSAFGFFVGVVPGISGHFAMAMVVGLLYGMEPAAGIVFLMAAHATVTQGGGLTAILFSIPGTGQNAATLLDGPRMRDKGEAGVAVGAAMTACFFGATFGAITLALLVPILREVVLVFGPSEIFLVCVLGLIFVAVLGGRDLRRATIAGLLGLFLALIGTENASYDPRFTFGIDALADGISLVPLVLGLFAVAEMMQLWERGGRLLPDDIQAPNLRTRQSQLLRGAALSIRHWWLVARCSTIGTVMGLIPGLGSAPASFVAYGHARQFSDRKDEFGSGCVEGVIAPEAANDAVEGGALASTVAFGVPGSSSMAILLTGITILGLETGPRMLGPDLDILYVMIFTIILGNLLGAIAGMSVANPIVHLTTVRSTVMVPVILAIVVSGAYAANGSLADVATALLFGGVGYLASLLRYSRAAMLIGFVLGDPIEYNLNLAVQIDGPLFFLDPIPLAFCAIGILFLIYSSWSVVRQSRAQSSPTGKKPPEATKDTAKAGRLLRTEMIVLALVFVLVSAACIETILAGLVDPVLPLLIVLPLQLLIVSQFLRSATFSKALKKPDQTLSASKRLTNLLAAGPLLWLAILLIGHFAALFLFVAGLMGSVKEERWRVAMTVATLTVAVLWSFFSLLIGADMFDGLILRYFSGYRDF